MSRPTLMLLAAVAMASCATPDAAPVEPADEPVGESTVPTSEPAAGEIEVAEIPSVPSAAHVHSPHERICSNERRTGSNRVKRVCRTSAQVEREEVEGKKVFEDLHRSQVEY